MFKRAGKKDCNCQTSLSPLYQTVTARSDSSDSARAFVTMRGSILVDSTQGMMRLAPAGTYELSFATIASILNSQIDILYFDRTTDKTLFLLVYPDFEGRI